MRPFSLGMSASNANRLDELHAEEMNSLDDSSVTCMMLHPVAYPNHGPIVELNLASEALGLVSSLDWDIEKGPQRHDISTSED